MFVYLMLHFQCVFIETGHSTQRVLRITLCVYITACALLYVYVAIDATILLATYLCYIKAQKVGIIQIKHKPYP